MLNDSLYRSTTQEWETPQFLFDRLDNEFDFTVDVCAIVKNAKCIKYYDATTQGLSQNWQGVAWMNPPYGREIINWVKKAFESAEKGCICVCLLPVRSDTRWWHNYVMRASEIRLLSKRLSFGGSSNKAPFPAAIVVFGTGKNNEVKLSSLVI